MANEISTSSIAADLVPLVIRDKLLEYGEEQLLFAKYGMPIEIPEGNGKVVQCTRYERVNLPTQPITEGVTPGNTDMRISTVQGVVDQWGATMTLYDVAQMTAKHPLLSLSQRLLGEQRAETLDREIQRVLLGSSNVTYAASRTARSSVVAGDNLVTADVRKVVALLRNQGARPFSNGKYIGIIDPSVEQDLNADTTFVNAAYNQTQAGLGGKSGGLVAGKIADWMGVSWYTSNFLPTLTRLTGVATGTTTGGSMDGMTGFTAGSTVRCKVTKLDSRTGVETVISDELSDTNASAFTLDITLTLATTGAGTFNIYVTLVGGATGTATFQRQIVYTSGATVSYKFGMAGTPGTPATSMVVTATGAVAPPSINSAAGTTIHTGYIFGQDYYGVTKLGGLTTTLTPATASDSDPLIQRRKVGWKQMYKALILNTQFGRRIEMASAY